jgi:hypothetical protein
MATVYQCDKCKKQVPLDDITDINIEQTRDELFEFELCDDCLFAMIFCRCLETYANRFA